MSKTTYDVKHCDSLPTMGHEGCGVGGKMPELVMHPTCENDETAGTSRANIDSLIACLTNVTV